MKISGWLFLVLLVVSCGRIQNLSNRIEASHYALYEQKVLLVSTIQGKKVILTNPQGTRFYFLKGKQFALQWAPGDTFVIDSNLTSFYRLRFINP